MVAFCEVDFIKKSSIIKSEASEKINEIQEIYRVLFVKHNNVTKALDMIEAEFKPTEIRDEIVDFIRNSNRGVMKGFGSGS